MTILLVEDSLQDIEIFRRAFRNGSMSQRLEVVRDGEEALDYLYRRGKYGNGHSSPRPAVIVLDLNLPKIDGVEVLRQIKSDPCLRSTPVIILTASPRDEDINRCYQLGVNTYIQKPVEYERFIQMMRAVQDYWTVIATLPPGVEG